jgi:hypothetical protein
MTLDDGNPVAVYQDRYQGVYSGGAWIAVAEANELVDLTNTRVQFCLVGSDGPSGGDIDAAAFWKRPPDWIAAGSSPAEAMETLFSRAKFASASDTWGV